MPFRNILSIILLVGCIRTYGQQQDVTFHLNAHLFAGKNILRVKKDFYDPYVWVLAQNNGVYRVNSLTLAIDDYTSQFSAYSKLQFVDIAGRSQDTVFVATNSTNVIEMEKGIFKQIGTSDGVPGVVNSIGIAEGSEFLYTKIHGDLMIASDKGFRYYNPVTEAMAPLQPDPADSKIYEATYRTEVFKDSSTATSVFMTGDTIQYQPVGFVSDDAQEFVEFLWEGGKEFGYNINTSVVVSNTIYSAIGSYSNSFWGNKNGMFQNFSNFSYNPASSPSGHYLSGINVNKITNIYGLTAFGSGEGFFFDYGLIKQNLLIGTDKGFYFSSSIYTGGVDPLKTFSLFHDDELGNIIINDVCVNAASTGRPICEDGVWIGAINGLYLLKPDYSPYLQSQTLQAISFRNQLDTSSTTNVCSGDSVLAIVNTFEYNGNTLQWYKNGQELPAQSRDTLNIKTAGDYYALLYDPCTGIHIQSNHLKVTVINGPIFSFNYANKIQECSNAPDTLKTDNNPGYHYRWYTNGVLNGDTTSSLIVTITGLYKVEVSACTNSWVPSKEVEVDMVTLPLPQLTADKLTYCAGDVATLSVNLAANPAYTINWYCGGIVIPGDKNLTAIKDTAAGAYTVTLTSNIADCTQTSLPLHLEFTPGPVFTSEFPPEVTACNNITLNVVFAGNTPYRYRWYTNGSLNGDTTSSLLVTQSGMYYVEASSCPGSWVPSKQVQVNLILLPVPVIKTDKTAYCTGDNAGLSIAIPVNPAYTITWYRDNIPISSYANQTNIITNTPGNYSVLIVANTANSDGSTCSQASAMQTLSFDDPPVVAIEKIVKTTLCTGQTVILSAKYSGGTVLWSNGETSAQIDVVKPGLYKVTVTSSAGCQAADSVAVSFLPDPVVTVKDTSVCTYKHQTIMLTAPSGYRQYAWNGINGGSTYPVSQPQTVSLVVTDSNGCQSIQYITVSAECPEVEIPNTFTPNNDGINDTWVIEGLHNDQSVSVRIFNRYGLELFESKGYGTPWNGEYHGKRLPAGTYYYILTAKSGTQRFSGPLTIIY